MQSDIYYSFVHCPPLLESEEVPTKYILRNMRDIAPDLLLYATGGVFTDSYNRRTPLTVYRIESPALKMTFDFVLTSMIDVGTLMLRGPRGSGFKVKKFLIHQIAQILFDVGFEVISGAVRNPDLMKLFEHFGFVRRAPNSPVFQLTREAFEKQCKKNYAKTIEKQKAPASAEAGVATSNQ